MEPGRGVGSKADHQFSFCLRSLRSCRKGNALPSVGDSELGLGRQALVTLFGGGTADPLASGTAKDQPCVLRAGAGFSTGGGIGTLSQEGRVGLRRHEKRFVVRVMES